MNGHQDYTGFVALVRPAAMAAHHRRLVRDLLQGGLTSAELIERAMQRFVADELIRPGMATMVSRRMDDAAGRRLA